VYKETLYSQGGLGVVKAALKVSTVATPYGLSSEYLYFPFGILEPLFHFSKELKP